MALRSNPASRCASALSSDKPIVVLPGFPTSAIFTFHAFVAPVIRARAGLPPEAAETISARVPVRVASELGRKEFVLVSLVEGEEGAVAFPTGKGSGAVTSFSQADGFLEIDALASALDADSDAQVTLIGNAARAPDLVIMGSHDVALDVVVGALADRGFSARTLAVGSLGGVAAANRGECDIAPVHLIDPATGQYNKHLLGPGLSLVPGWRRMQGISVSAGRYAFRGPQRARGAESYPGRCLRADGQSQCRRRHARPDRQTARWRATGGLRQSAEVPQCGGSGDRAGPRRLGPRHRTGGEALWPRVPARLSGALRLSRRRQTARAPGGTGIPCCVDTMRTTREHIRALGMEPSSRLNSADAIGVRKNENIGWIYFFLHCGLIIFAVLMQFTPAQAQLRGHGGPVKALAISPDGTHAVSGSFDTSAIRWSLARNSAEQVLRFHDGAVNAVAYLKDGRVVTAGADTHIAIWTTGRQQPDKILDGHTGPIAGLAVSPDGTVLASASWDHTVRLWPLNGSEPRVLEGNAQNVNGVAFSPDGKNVVSAGYDATLRIWPLKGGSEIVRNLPTPLNAVAVAPDGEILASGANGKVYFLSPTGETLADSRRIADTGHRTRHFARRQPRRRCRDSWVGRGHRPQGAQAGAYFGRARLAGVVGSVFSRQPYIIDRRCRPNDTPVGCIEWRAGGRGCGRRT